MLKDLLKKAGTIGPVLLTLVLSVPFVFFIAIPGLSMIFGLVILIVGSRLALHRPFWIPAFLERKEISGDRIIHCMVKIIRFLKKIEKYVKPRGRFHNERLLLSTFNGCILALSGFFLLLPLPPGTNFLPGLTVLLLSLGILEGDIGLIIGSYTAFFLNGCLLTIPFFLIH